MEQALIQFGALGVFAAALWKLHERCEQKLISQHTEHRADLAKSEERLQAISTSFREHLEQRRAERKQDNAEGRARHIEEHQAAQEIERAVLDAITRMLAFLDAHGDPPPAGDVAHLRR